MPVRRHHLELSVERPLGNAGSVARLSASFELGPSGEGPSAAELARALEELVRELDGAVGPTEGAAEARRGARDLRELVETYRPRQRELVDLLLSDGEITAAEHASLVANLGASGTPAASAPASADLTRVGETPIAAVPLSAEPRLPPARAVPELLRTFQITTLRQAGAVRAKRQISFAEYMALKRHFEAAGSGDAAEAARASGPG